MKRCWWLWPLHQQHQRPSPSWIPILRHLLIGLGGTLDGSVLSNTINLAIIRPGTYILTTVDESVACIGKDTVRVIRPGIDKIVKVPDATLSCGEDGVSAIQDLNKTGIPGLMVGLQRNGEFVPTDKWQNPRTHVRNIQLFFGEIIDKVGELIHTPQLQKETQPCTRFPHWP